MVSNANLILETRALLNDTTTNPIPHLEDSTILQFLQRSVNDLCIETDINYRAYQYTHSGADITSISFINLTGGAEIALYSLKELSIKQVSDGYIRVLKRVNYTNNERIKDNDNDRVIACHIYDNTVYFNVKVKDGDIILISGRWRKPDLTLGGSYPLDSMAEDCSVKYSTSTGYYTQTKVNLGDIWFKQYAYRKQQIEAYYKDMLQAKDPGAVTVRKKSNSLGYDLDYIGAITA